MANAPIVVDLTFHAPDGVLPNSVHVNVQDPRDYSPRFDSLEEKLVATKEEVVASLTELKASLAETAKDVQRVADTLAGVTDLNQIAALVEELKSSAAAINNIAETAVPELPTPPPNPLDNL